MKEFNQKFIQISDYLLNSFMKIKIQIDYYYLNFRENFTLIDLILINIISPFTGFMQK